MQQRKPLKRKTPLKARSKKIPHPSELPPLPKARVKVRIPKGDSDRERAASFRFVTMAKNRGRCIWPGCRARAVHAHHTTYRQHCPPGMEYDARNGAPLCFDHHGQQHGAGASLPLNALLPENLEFAREVLGDRADDYLRRRYAVEDERGDG